MGEGLSAQRNTTQEAMRIMDYDAGEIDAGRDTEAQDMQETERRNTPGCFGGCSEVITRQNWLDELKKSAGKSGNSITEVAHEAATDAVFAKLEFFQGQTLFHVSFRKTDNGRWENSGKDLTELFDPDEPGGDRGDRYARLKKDMNGSKVGMVFSEPTITDNLNYIHVFVDMERTVEEYIVQYRGTADEFASVYTSFSRISDGSGAAEEADFARPLKFARDVPLDSFVDIIESSYVSDTSKDASGEYILRLKHDIAHLSQIDTYQEEAKQLAEYLEKQMLSQGMSHALLHVLAGDLDAYATGNATVSDLQNKHISTRESVSHPARETQTVTDVVGYMSHVVSELPNVQSAPESTSLQFIGQYLQIADQLRSDDTSGFMPDKTNRDLEKQEIADARWIQFVQARTGASPEDAHALIQSGEAILNIYTEQWNAIEHVTDMSMGYGAAFFALDVLTYRHIPEADNTHHLYDDVAEGDVSTELGDIVFNSGNQIFSGSVPQDFYDGFEAYAGVFAALFSPDIRQSIEDGRTVIPHEIHTAVFIRLAEFIQGLDSMSPINRESAIVREKTLSLTNIYFLWARLIAYTTDHALNHESKTLEFENIRYPRDTVYTDRFVEDGIYTEAHPVENFSSALMFWMVIQQMTYYTALERVHTVIRSKGREGVKKAIQKNEQSAHFIQRESSPWLLLAIIWELAMIREQGFAQSTGTQTSGAGTKKNSSAVILNDAFFPDYGIIFTFNS